jgi:hypothetical protein
VNTKATTFATLAAVMVMLAYWVAGYDFDKRGDDALFCYILTVLTFVAVYFHPGFHKEQP